MSSLLVRLGRKLGWLGVLGMALLGTPLAGATPAQVSSQVVGSEGTAAERSLTLPAQVALLPSRASNYGINGATGSHVNVSMGNTYNYDSQSEGWFYYNWQVAASETELDPDVTNSLATRASAPVRPSSRTPSREATREPPSKQLEQIPANSARQQLEQEQAPQASATLPAVPRQITSAWLRVNLPLYLEHAVDQPSDNNVLAFLYLQAFANQKAWIFSERAKLVAQGNDYLDNNGAFPNLYTARAYREQLAKHIRATLFNKFQNQVGLILLISSDYESRAFAQLVGLFSLKYNMKFVTANLHGRFQPDLANYNQITNLREVAQLVRKQQAQIYPTLYVVDRNQTTTLVTGAIDSDELEQRMLRYLFRQNYISQTEYNMARGILLDPQQSDVELATLINGKLLQGQVRGTGAVPIQRELHSPSSGGSSYAPYGAVLPSVSGSAMSPWSGASTARSAQLQGTSWGGASTPWNGRASTSGLSNLGGGALGRGDPATILSSYLQGGLYVP